MNGDRVPPSGRKSSNGSPREADASPNYVANRLGVPVHLHDWLEHSLVYSQGMHHDMSLPPTWPPASDSESDSGADETRVPRRGNRGSSKSTARALHSHSEPPSIHRTVPFYSYPSPYMPVPYPMSPYAYPIPPPYPPPPPPPAETKSRFVSLPPADILTLPTLQRSQSDPLLSNKENGHSDRGAAAEKEQDAVGKLLADVTRIKSVNRKLKRELNRAHLELELLRAEKQVKKTETRSEYQPGAIAAMVKEIRDAEKVRDDAMAARLRNWARLSDESSGYPRNSGDFDDKDSGSETSLTSLLGLLDGGDVTSRRGDLLLQYLSRADDRSRGRRPLSCQSSSNMRRMRDSPLEELLMQLQSSLEERHQGTRADDGTCRRLALLEDEVAHLRLLTRLQQQKLNSYDDKVSNGNMARSASQTSLGLLEAKTLLRPDATTDAFQTPSHVHRLERETSELRSELRKSSDARLRLEGDVQRLERALAMLQTKMTGANGLVVADAHKTAPAPRASTVPVGADVDVGSAVSLSSLDDSVATDSYASEQSGSPHHRSNGGPGDVLLKGPVTDL